jgi:hypothetical protein
LPAFSRHLAGTLIAHYNFDGTASDAVGENDDAIINAPYEEGGIYIAGSSQRWLGFYLDAEGEPYMTYNSGHTVEGTYGAVTLDEWHTEALIFDGTTAQATIDGVVFASMEVELQQGTDRRFVSYDSGFGKSFLGHLRNLKVFNGVDESLPADGATLGAVKAFYR